jgi:hypothetical protein
MPSFPNDIPALEAADRASATLPDSVIRTQMDTGPAKVRRRSTAEPTMMRLGHPAYTTTQMRALVTFFETTVAAGALAFDMDDPVSGTTRSFRFMRPPQLKPQGAGLWAIDVELERLP